MPFLRRPGFDAVIVAVRFHAPGQIEWVRAFERRGAIWSDRRIIKRADLIARIAAGEKMVTGKRIPFEAGSFETQDPVRVEERNGQPVVRAGSPRGEGDSLAGIPAL